MFDLHELVALKVDRDDIGVKSTFLGTVIDVVDDGAAYSVEFVDDNGETVEDSIFAYFLEDELVALNGGV